MAYTNGRLPPGVLGAITTASNGQRARLRKDAAAAFNAMNAESVRRFGVTLRVSSARTAYRPLADQQYFWNLYRSGRGNLAARPGTSNHGWGLAVDLANPGVMRPIIDRIGAKYGWQKHWSDAPSEPWHLKWRPGRYPAVQAATFRPLRYRSQGPRVRWVQRRLRAKGFLSVRASGWYGESTRSAVTRFQRKHGLTPDGVIGRATWRRLAS
ncbi:MAG: hypothetical protein AVDCRST_MAG68-2129 [uncultured Gemmatimonadetes bacterium]|uniref:Uncharacterized protein n=1 Tax=uncultured Gemmatimonadota bacterium TaxID=203437 RepID=A0A6J4LAZ5_9BACT|nr:MAG: hypothetical protein AVDCRST_MAG68-2129 [uncultured Gemmatimonadota bacterium]